MDDANAFERLKSVVVSHGHTFETGPVDRGVLERVSSELSLPPGFVSLYVDHGPVPRSSIPWVVEDLLVVSFEELPEAQDGYGRAGDGRTPSPSWQTGWVVVASVFGDPFFIDTSRDGCPVLFARHGAGIWSPVEVASSMEAFINSLVGFEIVLLDGFDLEVWDDNGLLPQFVGQIEQELAGILTSEQAAAFAAILD
jgi:hypothetical protein